MDGFLRILTFLLYGLRFFYWHFTETQADKEKPKTKSATTRKWLFDGSLGLLVAIQLLGMQLVPFSNSHYLQVVGLLLVIVGVAISIEGRRILGANWSHAVEYQIKQDQKLVTKGIYRYIRHPIYSGYYLSLIGVELVVGSYLVFLVIASLPLVYFLGKREEKLLEEHFGKAYSEYKKKTSMLIPFIL